MNLSKQKYVVTITDGRCPGEKYVHRLRMYTNEERLDYQRSMSKAMGIKADGSRAPLHDMPDDPSVPTCDMYDKLAESVEGYTVDGPDGSEVNATSVDGWRDHIPREHKNAVVGELLPQVEVVKN